jgi:hypothetical protein
MIVVVAGNRNITDYAKVKAAIEASGFHITKIVSGCASGVDSFGEKWAVEEGIPVHRMPAKWKIHGHAAGPIRNSAMADYIKAHEVEFGGCAVIAVGNLFKPNGDHTGTGDMVDNAEARDIQVFHAA